MNINVMENVPEEETPEQIIGNPCEQAGSNHISHKNPREVSLDPSSFHEKNSTMKLARGTITWVSNSDAKGHKIRGIENKPR